MEEVVVVSVLCEGACVHVPYLLRFCVRNTVAQWSDDVTAGFLDEWLEVVCIFGTEISRYASHCRQWRRHLTLYSNDRSRFDTGCIYTGDLGGDRCNRWWVPPMS